MSFASLLVTIEWLLTVGFVSFVGYAITHGIEQAYGVLLQTPLIMWFTNPSSENLIRLFG